jgi:hypothetical protein
VLTNILLAFYVTQAVFWLWLNEHYFHRAEARRAKKRQTVATKKTEPYGGSDDGALTKGDSYTLLALLVGVLLMLIVPTLPFKTATLVILCVAFWWFCRKCHWTSGWTNRGKNALGTISIFLLLVLLVPQLYSEWQSRERVKPVIHITDFHPRYGSLEQHTGYRAWVDIDTQIQNDQVWHVLSISRTRLIPFPAKTFGQTDNDAFSEMGKDQSLYTASQLTMQPGKTYRIHAVSENEIPAQGRDGQLGIDDLDARNASIFSAGIIRYKDKKGCVYQTYYCGIWRGSGQGFVFNEMNHCPGGHNSEAIRTGDECTP